MTLAAGEITVKGPLGTLEQRDRPRRSTSRSDGDKLTFKARGNSSQAPTRMSGTMRALVANMVTGVTEGFEKKLTLVGVGYRAQAQGDKLNLSLGFSHPVVHADAQGRQGRDADADRDRDQGHRQAAGRPGRRRDPRLPPPEPYKGKGVRYAGEQVVLKETKKK